jgi:anti-sigma-K factor RskA
MTDPDSGRTFAAEYLLGVLDPASHAEAERRAATDVGFAHEVAAWRRRFVEFDETAESLPPNESLWRRIEASIQGPPPHAARINGFSVSALWSSLAVWRWATLGAVAAALILAVVTGATIRDARELAARKPIFIAVLLKEGTNDAGAVVNAFANGRAELIPLTDVPVPAGRALEIWTLWDRAVGPRSIGLIDRARTVRLDLSQLPPTGPDQLFEVTLEPATGSPTGRPTGPILFKGTTSRAL